MNAEYFSFCPTLQKLIDDGKATGATGKIFQSLPALSTVNNLKVLREFVLKERVTSSLEIGLAFGGSALTLLSTMSQVSGDKPFSHTAIDPFQKTVWDSVGLRLLDGAGLTGRFTLIEDQSSFVLPDLVRHGKQFELIYVDGSHLFEDVFVDFYFVSQLLKPGGFALFDDCADRNVAKVVKFIRRNYTKILEEVDLTHWAGPMSVRRRAAHFFGYRQLQGFRKTTVMKREWNANYSEF